jgi:rhodanese-related sulfurtransferase
VNEAAVRLARVGVDTVVGFLDGGVGAWAQAGRPVATLKQIAVADLAAALPATVLDVRRPGEFAAGHLPGAHSVPLDQIADAAVAPPPIGPLYVVCASGYRSSAAASILAARGLDVVNVVGGTNAWVAAGFPVEV